MREITFKEIELRNFKCHEELAFSFVPNRFVTVVGHNGAGKTTLFSALAWALYDETIEGMSGDDVVRKRSGKDTMVSVTWDDGDDHYKVVAYRKDSEFKNSRFLYKNDTLITCNTARETLARIAELIMEKDVFFNCLLFSKYVKNHFLDLTPGGRSDILDSMLLLHKYTVFFKKAGALLDKIDKDVSSENQQLEVLRNSLTVYETSKKKNENDVYELKRLAAESEQRLSTIIATIKEKIIPWRVEVGKLFDLRTQFSAVSTNITELEGKISSQREICKLELDNLDRELASEKASIQTNIEAEINIATKELTDKLMSVESEISKLATETATTLCRLEEKASGARKRDLEEKTSVLTSIKEEIKVLEKEIERLLSALKEVKSSAVKKQAEIETCESHLSADVPTCSFCNQPLSSTAKTEVDDKLKIMKSDYSKMVDRISDISSTIEEKNKQLSLAKDNLSAREAHYTNLEKELEEKIAKAKKDVADKNSSLDSKLKELKKETETAILNAKKPFTETCERRIADVDSKKISLSTAIKDKNKTVAMQWITEKDSLIKTREELEKTIKEIDDICVALQKEETLLTQSEQELKSNEVQYAERIKSAEENIRSSIELIKTVEEKINECLENIAALERRRNILKFWKTGYSDTGIKSMLLDDAIPVLNGKSKELCEMAPNLKIRFDSQTALKSGDYTNKFGIEVLQTRNLSGLKELSSGEKRMTDIIVLLCLRHLLEDRQNTRMNILLLDEILDSLDPENAALAVAMVKKLSEDHCVVLISHTLRDFIESDEMYNMSM